MSEQSKTEELGRGKTSMSVTKGKARLVASQLGGFYSGGFINEYIH